MTRIFVDGDLQSKLLGLGQPAELCDATGRILGRFFPAIDLSKYEAWEPLISEEELRRREQSTEKRYTTAEVLAHLEKL